MTTHTFHPDTHEYGLADGCPRCDEHAERPLDGLDQENLANLIDRVQRHEEPRSANEYRAMYMLEKALLVARQLGPFLTSKEARHG